MVIATFQRTALTAFYGFSAFVRIVPSDRALDFPHIDLGKYQAQGLLVSECLRLWRYLTCDGAIALYRNIWTGFLIVCFAFYWLGTQTRALVQPIVDRIVDESLEVAAVDAPAPVEPGVEPEQPAAEESPVVPAVEPALVEVEPSAETGPVLEDPAQQTTKTARSPKAKRKANPARRVKVDQPDQPVANC